MAETFTRATENMKVDDKVAKKIVGEALSCIDGVLGVKGGLADLLKGDDDRTRGVVVNVNDNQQITVCAKVITESGKNMPGIVKTIEDKITKALQSTTGLEVKDVVVEIADVMTKDEYEKQFGKQGSIKED